MTHIALIGSGQWGRNILRTLRSFPDVSVMVVGKGVTPPKSCDAVVIATPSATHAAIALPYITRGIPTFIEKPMATSVRDAQRIVEASEKAGTLVFVGHLHLFNPVFLKALELLPRIGRVQSMVCDSANDRPRSDSSVLWDWLPHDLSMACALFGESPTAVEAWNLTGARLAQAALCRFSFGRAHLVSTMSWLSAKKRRHVAIIGARGTVTIDESAQRTLTLIQGASCTHPRHSGDTPLARELAAFIQSVRSKKKARPDADDGAAIVRMIASAETSARLCGRVQTISDAPADW